MGATKEATMRFIAIVSLLILAACTPYSSNPRDNNYSQDLCFSMFGNGWKANNEYLQANGTCPKKS